MASSYEKAMQKYQELIGGQSSFSDMLNKMVGEKTNYNADLIAQQNALKEQTYSLPAQLRAQYASSPIRNPLEMENLIAQRRGNVGQQLGTVTDLLNARGQSLSSLLQGGLGAYQSQIDAAKAAADAALNAEQLRLQEQSMKSSKGGGMSDYLAAMYGGGGGGTTQQPTGRDVADYIHGTVANEAKKQGVSVTYGKDLKSQGKSKATSSLAQSFIGNAIAPGIGLAAPLITKGIRGVVENTKLGKNLTSKLASSKLGQSLINSGFGKWAQKQYYR